MQPDYSQLIEPVIAYAPVIVFVMVFLGVLQIAGRLLSPKSPRRRWRGERREWRQRRGWNTTRQANAEAESFLKSGGSRVPDAAEQLRIVMASEFKTKRLLNKGEEKVLAALEPIVAELQPGWRVWTQVSLGEVLDGGTVEAFNTINAKRVDFLLVDADQRPRLAIEYQGAGAPPRRGGRPRRRQARSAAAGGCGLRRGVRG